MAEDKKEGIESRTEETFAERNLRLRLENLNNPCAKLYDPWDEYEAYDGQRSEQKKQETPKDALTRWIEANNCFVRGTEIYDSVTGRWRPYSEKIERIISSQSADALEEKPIPPESMKKTHNYFTP